jgi:hypothetical protein
MEDGTISRISNANSRRRGRRLPRTEVEELQLKCEEGNKTTPLGWETFVKKWGGKLFF